MLLFAHLCCHKEINKKLKMQKILTLVLFLLTGALAWGQIKNLPSAKHKEYYSDGFLISASALDYSSITQEIVGTASSSYDKAQAIYLWLCKNIAYDTQGKIRTADECWKARKGVCQGYCELFFRMAETVGLKTKLVYGECKNSIDPKILEKHVWLSVHTEEGELLLDPTWGAGLCVNGKFVQQQSPLLWFNTNPHWFIFTHFPQKDKHQHLDRQVSKGEFTKLPFVNPIIAKLGVTPRKALEQALAGEDTFPVIPVLNTEDLKKVTLHNVPLCRHLKLGQSYYFQVEKNQDNCKIWLSNEGNAREEERWDQNGKLYSTTVAPKTKGKFTLEVSSGNSVLSQRKVLLEYTVE